VNCTKNLGLARSKCCAWTDDDRIVVRSFRMGVSHRLHVDCSEQNAALLKLASECGDFDVSVVRLRADLRGAHHELYGGPKPPPLHHDGINDMFVGKASVVWYRYQGRWLQRTGAD